MQDSLHIVCPHCSAINRVPRNRLHDQPTCGKCSQLMFVGQPAELNAEQFTQHIARNNIPVLVDFWAPWCGPCRMMAPAFVQAAQRLEPDMRVVKLNTEQVQEIAARHGVRSIPTLALFKDGREVARQAGAVDASVIVAWAKAQA